ncbi:MAG: hypothetical protein IPJ65_38580 [Archangiaceae bacterium]|nr:hypothetical protein [Archangiaceae bacterium]
MFAPIALCLLGHLDPSHFAGALTEAPQPAPDSSAFADGGGPSDADVTQLSRPQLQAEFERLAKYRTEFIGPTVMGGAGLVVGLVGGVMGLGGVTFLIASSEAHRQGDTQRGNVLSYLGFGFAVVGGVAFTAGVVFLVIGLVRLFPALERRRLAVERRNEIEKRLQQLAPEPLPNPPAQPTAPPMPGDAWRAVPQTLVPVAYF